MSSPSPNSVLHDAPSPVAWVVGSCGGADRELELAAAAAGWLAEPIELGDLRRLIDPDDPPAAVLVCHERPTQAKTAEIAELRSLLADTPLLSVAGSWCEAGPARPSPDTGCETRVWHDVGSWLAAVEVAGAALAGSACGLVGEGALVVIEALDFDSADAVSQALAAEGFATSIRLPSTRGGKLLGVGSAVWIGGQLDGLESARLADFCRRYRSRSTAAVLDFPRPDEVELARRLGAGAVLGKPWRLGQLLQSLRPAVDGDATPAPTEAGKDSPGGGSHNGGVAA